MLRESRMELAASVLPGDDIYLILLREKQIAECRLVIVR